MCNGFATLYVENFVEYGVKTGKIFVENNTKKTLYKLEFIL